LGFKVLVYHDMPDSAIRELTNHGIDIKRGKNPTEAGICEDIQDCDALVAFEQPEHGFGKTIMDAAPQLKLIARRGVGYETVDVDYATQKGVYVTNTPAINSRTVAEAAIMLMLECARNAQKVNEKFRKEKSKYSMFTSDVSTRGFELTGKTLGLIGCGNIGKHVAQIASQGFGMKVYGHDAYVKDLPEYITKVDEMNEIFKVSDFVSLHLPSTKETRHSIGMEQFRLMKSSAFVINTSRGDIIREEELIEALKTSVIRGAGLDVYSTEPISENAYPLFDMDRVEMTPHNASFTIESLLNAVRSVVKSVIEVSEGTKPTFAVNDPIGCKD